MNKKETEPQGLDGRKLFVVTFVVEEPAPQDGQPPRGINVPAFVADWQTAAEKAREYIAAFPSTPEAKQLKDAKLKLQSIMIGGTILT
jgi:hypothetical protein